MRAIVTTAIVLYRTDFKEADRIVTMLTRGQGKIRVIAKGVRRPLSKLAGGIELFSICQITFLPGRGEIKTLISSRLQKHYGNIVKDIQRTMLGYDFIKRINKITEDAVEDDYFDLLEGAFGGLDNLNINSDVLEFWFDFQLLRLGGHSPNLSVDLGGNQLKADQKYSFDYDNMLFVPNTEGQFNVNHIKLMRLAFRTKNPAILAKISGIKKLVLPVAVLAKNSINLSYG